jgi:hypothetical protein
VAESRAEPRDAKKFVRGSFGPSSSACEEEPEFESESVSSLESESSLEDDVEDEDDDDEEEAIASSSPLAALEPAGGGGVALAFLRPSFDSNTPRPRF